MILSFSQNDSFAKKINNTGEIPLYKGKNAETSKTGIFSAIFFGALVGFGAGLMAGSAFSIATAGVGFGAIFIGALGGTITGGVIGLISYLFISKILNKKNSHQVELDKDRQNNTNESGISNENIVKDEEIKKEISLNSANLDSDQNVDLIDSSVENLQNNMKSDPAVNIDEDFIYVPNAEDENLLNEVRKYLVSNKAKAPKENATDEEKLLGPKQFAKDLGGMDYQIGRDSESAFHLDHNNKIGFVNRMKSEYQEAFLNICIIAAQTFAVEIAVAMAKSYQQKEKVEDFSIAYGQPIKSECILEQKDGYALVTFIVHLRLHSTETSKVAFQSGLKSIAISIDDASVDWFEQLGEKLLEQKNQGMQDPSWYSYLRSFVNSEKTEANLEPDLTFVAPSLKIENSYYSEMYESNMDDAKNEIWQRFDSKCHEAL
jgi:hypothetical protein